MRTVYSIPLIALLMVTLSCGKPSLFGISYMRLNCSQLACRLTGHSPATAAQLYSEGRAIDGPLQPGDIVAFHGSHVAVVDVDGGLVDSIPERGVGRVSLTNQRDPWYSGPVRVVR